MANPLLRVIVFGVLLVVATFLVSQGITVARFEYAIVAACVLAVFMFVFLKTEAGLYLVLFSMLLSPEFALGGGGLAERRTIVVRLEDLLLIAIALSWFAKTAVNKEIGLVVKTPLNPWILFYVLSAFLSTALGYLQDTVKSAVGFMYVLKYVEYFVVFYMTVNNVRDRAQARRLIMAAFATAAMVSIIGAAQSPSGQRVSAPFDGEAGEPNTFGGYQLLMMASVDVRAPALDAGRLRGVDQAPAVRVRRHRLSVHRRPVRPHAGRDRRGRIGGVPGAAVGGVPGRPHRGAAARGSRGPRPGDRIRGRHDRPPRPFDRLQLLHHHPDHGAVLVLCRHRRHPAHAAEGRRGSAARPGARVQVLGMTRSPSWTTRARHVRLVVTDVDGVLTDGRMILSDHGDELKSFHTRDGVAVALARQAKLRTAMITGETSPIAKTRGDKLGVDVVVLGARRKGEALEALCAQFDLPCTAAAYIGDDLLDIPALQRAGLAVAVADAADEVKAVAQLVTRAPGGHGVFREVIERLLRAQRRWNDVLSTYVRDHGGTA